MLQTPAQTLRVCEVVLWPNAAFPVTISERSHTNRQRWLAYRLPSHGAGWLPESEP